VILQLRTAVSCWSCWVDGGGLVVVVCLCGLSACLQCQCPSAVLFGQYQSVYLSQFIQHHRDTHIHQLHILYQSPAAGIASPWKLPSTVKSAQHSLNTPSVGAFRSEPSSHTCPPPPPLLLLLLFIHQYHYHLLASHYFTLNGHLDYQEDITAASVLRPPPSATTTAIA
jgi:hypothetical protein